MQVTIEIPNEIINYLETKGKPLDVTVVESLSQLMHHDLSIDAISNQANIDWANKWEQWFTECENTPIQTSTKMAQDDNYKALLINKYRQQGLEL